MSAPDRGREPPIEAEESPADPAVESTDPVATDPVATDPVAPDLDEPLASGTLPQAVACPFCESADTSQFAVFGGQASTSQYYCNGCRTVFDFLRWR